MSMKYAIDLISGKLSSSNKSHKAGWAYLRKCQLENALNVKIDVLHGESWDDYDVIFLYHGMEQDGETLNLFGGATKDGAIFYERLLKYKNKEFISLDIPMPDYGMLCSNRLKNCDEYWAQIDWAQISEICKRIEFIDHPEITSKLVIGDSHCFSVYQPEYMTFRKDSRTLAGVLRKTIAKEINDFQDGVLKNLTHISCYYGNIDIRHHLCRENNPKQEFKILLDEYEKQIKELNIPNVELVAPLPIEDESRRLPKTGYFKGTPFYGTRKQRQELQKFAQDYLSEICEKNNWSLFTWPKEWYEIDGITFMKTYMESPKSVHLAPCYHRYNYWKNLV